VDDGSRTLEDALDGIRRMWDSGIRRIVTTPHFDGSLTRDRSLFRERLDEMDEAFGLLEAKVGLEFPDLEFLRGHEVMLDIPDPDLSDRRLHLGETDFVLVEWPGLQVPPGPVPVVQRLVASGIRPVIAHPERYRGLDRNLLSPGEWREAGALLQVNYGSLVGRYGETPRRRALSLLEKGWVDLMASDFHGRPHLSPFLKEAREIMGRLGAGPQFGLLAGGNPGRILRGEDPLPVPPVMLRPGVLDRLRGLFQWKERW
jgi:protein-tyrosine phosphatase